MASNLHLLPGRHQFKVASNADVQQDQTATQSPTDGAAKTARLTENKRRYRERKKEYVLDLERRLAEARQREIQATTEVQLAARQVVRENGLLRELLQLSGFDDQDIDAWAGRRDGYDDDDRNGANCARKKEVAQKARQCATTLAATRSSKGEVESVEMHLFESSTNMPPDPEELRPNNPDSKSHHCRSELDDAAASVHPTPPTSKHALTVRSRSPNPPAKENLDGKQISPCKLLTRLVENPSADITQVAVSSHSADPCQNPSQEGGVECAKAYEMLIPYATSEEKLDCVARALESGCTANGKGGCAVKSKVVWDTLESMCG